MGVVVILAISGFFLNFAPGNGLIFEAAFTIALIGVVTSIVLKFSKNVPVNLPFTQSYLFLLLLYLGVF